MKTIFLFLVLLSASGAIAQKNHTVELTNFNELKIFDGIHVELIPSDKTYAVIFENERSHIEFVQKNGLLKIRKDIDDSLEFSDVIKIKLYYNKLDLIDVNEGSVVSSMHGIKQASIELRTQEGARINLSLEVEDVKVKASTGGQLILSGTGSYAEIDVFTGGEVEAKKLTLQSVKANVKAGGDIVCTAKQKAELSTNAGGDIVVYGNPSDVNQKSFLGGSIRVTN